MLAHANGNFQPCDKVYKVFLSHQLAVVRHLLFAGSRVRA
jgi:hypothetical protein